jgi:alkyl hydroperoxide reductase subunit AhpC
VVHLLSWIAEDIKTEKNRPMFREFLADLQKMSLGGTRYGFPYRMLVQVLSLQRQAIGSPISFQFAAFDGHAVDTAMMKGKIVATIFWGTSYPECIPNVLRLDDLYKKYHAKGLEVLGVNVDHNSETLKKFVSDHKIESAQYWDGKEMENKIVQAARVIRAGTILLIDKKGLLHDMNADEELNKKVEALLVGD